MQRAKALATIASGPMAQLLRYSMPALQDYAERHGYDLVVGQRSVADRPHSWSKVPLIQRLLTCYDLVVWIDSDMTLLDTSLDVAEEVPEDAYQAYVNVYRPTTREREPNMGFWVFRSGPRAQAFLEAVWQNTEFIDHPFWENTAAANLLGYRVTVHPTSFEKVRSSEWTDGVHHLNDSWNSFVQFDGRSGRRIRHYCAMNNADRARYMRLDALEYKRLRNGSARRSAEEWLLQATVTTTLATRPQRRAILRRIRRLR